MGLAKLEKRVGFIGAGQMAEALARGFISKGVLEASSMIATDPVAARREVFQSFDVKAVTTNVEVPLQSWSSTGFDNHSSETSMICCRN